MRRGRRRRVSEETRTQQAIDRVYDLDDLENLQRVAEHLRARIEVVEEEHRRAAAEREAQRQRELEALRAEGSDEEPPANTTEGMTKLEPGVYLELREVYATGPDGEPTSHLYGVYRYTHRWEKRNGKWHHVTKYDGPVNPKRAPSKKRLARLVESGEPVPELRPPARAEPAPRPPRQPRQRPVIDLADARAIAKGLAEAAG